jgi:alcohol dehydrogenase
VGVEITNLGGKRPLIVTGRNIEAIGLLESLLTILDKAGLRSAISLESEINPTSDTIMAGVRQFHDAQCDSLIALGGGSRMDTAKAIRVMVAHGGQLKNYYFDVGGGERIREKMPPLICVPTTAGSGSEVSRGAIISDTQTRRKRLLAGPGVMADMAILDPELSVSMPPRLTIETGIDALSHALETYVGTNFNPFAEGMSRQAVKIIHANLVRAARNGNDLEARTQMLVGSAMGALGFAKGLGVVHSLAHQFLGIPHGLAIAILLPHGMEFNLETVGEAYADLAGVMGVACNDCDIVGKAQKAIATVRSYSNEFSLPQKLSDVGIVSDDIHRMAVGAMQDHCHRTNPRICTESDMQNILERAL